MNLIDIVTIFENLTIHNEGDLSVLFMIGPISVSTYGVFVLFGFLLVTLFCYLEWKNHGFSTFHFAALITLAAIFGSLGARWWYLAFNPQDIHGFFSFFSLKTGRSILGSIFFGIGSIFIYSKIYIKTIEWTVVFSIFAPNILIGQSLARWGNFYDYNVYGQPIGEQYYIPVSLIQEYFPNFSDSLNINESVDFITIYYQPNILEFLPDYIKSGMLIYDNDTATLAYRQPLFLYESLATFWAWIIITFICKNIDWFKKGTHGALFFIFYGIIRTTMELLRDDAYIMKIGDFPTSFFFAILLILLGIFTFIYFQWYKKQKNPQSLI
ncbi:MAG: hypothetical protein GQ557_01995 [Mycoplasmataceae bacterium]|nr:hypothetical protein [Mycoplasmataceae bacterium]